MRPPRSVRNVAEGLTTSAHLFDKIEATMKKLLPILALLIAPYASGQDFVQDARGGRGELSSD